MSELCDICIKRGKNKTARYECHDCRQRFCSDCHEYHQLFNRTKFDKVTSLVIAAHVGKKEPKKEVVRTNLTRTKTAIQSQSRASALENLRGPFEVQKGKQENSYDLNNVFKTKIIDDGRCVLAQSMTLPPTVHYGKTRISIHTPKTGNWKGGKVGRGVHDTDSVELSVDQRKTTLSRPILTEFSMRNDDTDEQQVEDPLLNSMEGGDQFEISVKDSDFLEVNFDQRKTKPRKPPFTKFQTKYFTDEHEPIITSIKCMLDDRIVLVDVKNRKLKLYRSTYDFQMEREISEGPYGVAPVNETKVAVTTTVRPLIKFYEFGDTIVKDIGEHFKLNLDGIGYGISFSKGKYAVLCNRLGNSRTYSTIRILDNRGNQILNIDCNKMFRSALKVDTLVLHDERIFVLNQGETTHENKVLCVSFNRQSAKVLWERSIDSIPVAIGLGDCGLLLACRSADGSESQIKEMQLTGEGDVQTIITEKNGSFSPRYVEFQKLNKRLVVSEVACSEVKVFEKETK